MLSITFQWIYDEDKVNAEGDEYICEDGDDYHEFQIEVNTVENSLYSQLLTSVFYGDDMPPSDFRSEELKNKLVRLTIVNNFEYVDSGNLEIISCHKCDEQDGSSPLPA